METVKQVKLNLPLIPHVNIYHKDARTTLFIEEECRNTLGGVSFKREKCYTNKDYILLKQKITGYTYVEQHINNINELNINKNYCEVLCSGKPIKLTFDLDDKTNGILINEIIDFCEIFKNYLNININEVNINDINIKEITYEILISVEPNEEFNSNKSYQSYHIVFNVYTIYLKIYNTHMEIVNNFLKDYGESIPFYENNNKIIDMTIYNTGKFYRTIGQSKGTKTEDGKTRTDIFKALNIISGEFKKIITTEMLVMAVNTNTDILYNYVPYEKVKKIKCKFNLRYVIPTLPITIKKWITELTEQDLTADWIKNISYLINVIIISGINDTDKRDIMTEFLDKSQFGEYIGLSHKQNNIEFIQFLTNEIYNANDINIPLTIEDKRITYNKKMNGDLITELTEIEKTELYRFLKKDNSEIVYLSAIPSPTGVYEIIIDGIVSKDISKSRTHYDLLYIEAYKTIVINAVINGKEIRGNQSKEYNLIVNYINNLSTEELQFNKETKDGKNNLFITDWDNPKLIKLTKEKDLCLICEAPTSSGKTYHLMRNRIKCILECYKKHEPRRIVVLTDTRSLTSATSQMIINLFNEFDIDLSYFKNYLDYTDGKTDKNEIQNSNTLLLLICIDSLPFYTNRFIKEENLTFTDCIIDEYQNISNGIIKKITNVNEDKYNQQKIMNVFYNVIKDTRSVLLLDADIYNYDRELLKKYTDRTFKYVRFIDYKQNTKKIILMDYSPMIEMITHKYKLGIPQSIAMSSRKQARNFYDKIIKLGMGKKFPILVMNTDGALDSRNDTRTNESKSLKNKLCGNTLLWRDYTMIIYNSTITTGISENTDIGEIPHFDTHYSILHTSATLTPNATARAQMDMRVRKTKTETLRVSVHSEKINVKTLQIRPKKDYEFCLKKTISTIQNLIYKQNREPLLLPPKLEEQMNAIKGIKSNSNNMNLTPNHRAKSKEYLKELYLISNYMEKEEQLFLELSFRKTKTIDYHNHEFLTIYLKTLRKWGINEIKTEFYKNISNEEFIKVVQLEKDTHIFTAEQCLFEAFNVDRKIYNYNDTDTKNEFDNNTCEIFKFGYSNYMARFYGKTEPYFNGILFNLIEHKYTHNQTHYNRLYDYYFYDTLKLILIQFVKNFNDQNRDELQRTMNSLNEDIRYLCNACILFELIKGGFLIKRAGEHYDYKEFMSDLIEERGGNCELMDTTLLKEGMINDLKPLLKYLLDNNKFTTITKTRLDLITINDYIKEAFNYFNTNTRIETQTQATQERYYVRYVSHKGIPFRLQKNDYSIEKNSDNNEPLLITNSDIDDYKTIITGEQLKDYTTITGFILNKKYMPKIKICVDKIYSRLFALIENYTTERNQQLLKDHLTKETVECKLNQIKISYEEAKEIQDELDRLYNETEINEEAYYNTIGGFIANTIIKGNDIRDAKRFYKWTVCENGGIYNENGEPQNIIVIPNCEPHNNENQLCDYRDMVKINKKEVINRKNVSFVNYRGRLFNVKLVIAEAFFLEYNDNSWIIPIDNDYTNNALINLKLIETEQEYKDLMKENEKKIKRVKNEIKKDITKIRRMEIKNEKHICDICGGEYTNNNKGNHVKTAKHLSYINEIK